MIACIVPTNRPDRFQQFCAAWAELFARHSVRLIPVIDGDPPQADGLSPADILGPDADLIYNHSDVCRNLGFAYVVKHLPDVTHVLTLDDDVAPHGDTIADHLAVLSRRAPLSWLSSSPDAYTRGFPYGVRAEAPVMVSHGVWYGNADWDAQTQLENGNAPLDTFYRGPIPKGALFPFCAMNVMVRREVLPWLYFAPMGPRVTFDGAVWDRFGDIWLGVSLKRTLDNLEWAMVSGFAAVQHTRASDVQTNLRKEETGLAWNESWWQWEEPIHPYFSLYRESRDRWQAWVEKQEGRRAA